MTTDHDELLRLRQLLESDLTLRIRDLERRMGGTERTLERVAKRTERIEKAVTGLVEEDKIATAVTSALKAQRAQLFSWPVKVAAIVVAISATATAIANASSSLLHHFS